ncbi:MAG: hypothetical protein WC516_08475 [Patescibacteria group bacterium]|jgi:hypothetical protein
MSYLKWKIEVIKLITSSSVSDVLKVEEIKCVLRDDGGYPESYKDKDTPEEAWDAELDAIASSV